MGEKVLIEETVQSLKLQVRQLEETLLKKNKKEQIKHLKTLI